MCVNVVTSLVKNRDLKGKIVREKAENVVESFFLIIIYRKWEIFIFVFCVGQNVGAAEFER